MKKVFFILSICLFWVVSCASPSGSDSSISTTLSSTTSTNTSNSSTDTTTLPSNDINPSTPTPSTDNGDSNNPSTPTLTEPTVPSYYLKMNYNEMFHICEVSFTNGINTTGYNLANSNWKGNGWAVVLGDNYKKHYLLCNINGTQYTITNLKYNNTLYSFGFANSNLYDVRGTFNSLDNSTALSGYDMYIESNKLKVAGSTDKVYKYIDTQNGYLVIINTNQ